MKRRLSVLVLSVFPDMATMEGKEPRVGVRLVERVTIANQEMTEKALV